MNTEAPDPRPSDMAELARVVAVELRKHSIWAEPGNRFAGDAVVFLPHATALSGGFYHVDDIDGGPCAIAAEIKNREAVAIQEWAGNK